MHDSLQPSEAIVHADFPQLEVGVARPLWSVMIPTYNCAKYLRETLQSVLSEGLGPDLMQIEVVDDCSSSDDPEAVVNEVGGGRITFYRQSKNVGHSRNFDTCISRARGHLVHILHGDDRVAPRFYQELGAAFENDPEIGAAFCSVSVTDEAGDTLYLMPLFRATSGRVDQATRAMALEHPVQTPAIVVRREVYETIGGFHRQLRYCGEDLEMWVRISSRFPIWYEPQYLAFYRTHPHSLSGTALRTGQNIRDVRVAIDSYRKYLPPDSAEEITKAARDRIAVWALNIARDAYWKGDFVVVRVQIREALLCSHSRPVLKKAVEFALWAAGWSARRTFKSLRRHIHSYVKAEGSSRGGGN